MSEKEIQRSIMDFLLMSPKVAWAYITTTGTVKGRHGGRPFNVGIPGLPDILGQMRDGKLFGIEVKQPGKEPTDKQAEFIKMIKDNNGLAGWATNLEEARRIIDG